MLSKSLLVLVVAIAWHPSVSQTGNASSYTGDSTQNTNPATTPSPYIPVSRFDDTRDPAADIRAAIAEAARTHKRVLLYIGGLWCSYCDQMETFFDKNPDLVQLRDANFITVHVAYGSPKGTIPLPTEYSHLLGIPHFFVVDGDGTLLHSQHVLDLRENSDYSHARMKQFLTLWSPPAPQASPR